MIETSLVVGRCAINQGRATESANEHTSVAVLKKVELRTELDTHHVGLVRGARNVRRAKKICVECRSPARAPLNGTAGIHTIEMNLSCARNRRRQIGIAST